MSAGTEIVAVLSVLIAVLFTISCILILAKKILPSICGGKDDSEDDKEYSNDEDDGDDE